MSSSSCPCSFVMLLGHALAALPVLALLGITGLVSKWAGRAGQSLPSPRSRRADPRHGLAVMTAVAEPLAIPAPIACLFALASGYFDLYEFLRHRSDSRSPSPSCRCT